MFISGGDAFLLKCKTVQKPSCFKTGFWITEYKTGEGDKPSKGGVWWCSSNKVLFWKLSKQKNHIFKEQNILDLKHLTCIKWIFKESYIDVF